MIGRRALVTAAGQGIGRACVERLLLEGADVWATDLNGEALARLGLSADRYRVVNSANCAEVAEFLADCPSFDAAIHCVGVVDSGTLLECSEQTWARAFAVNVDSYFHTVRGVLPGMIAAGRGSVVGIASVASSLKGLPNRAAYGATKAAMIGMTKSVAADYAANGVRCNAVCPGTVGTPSLVQRVAALGEQIGGFEKANAMFVGRQPLGRLGTAEEVAALCIYLASDESGFVTGQAIAIDGGISI